MDEKRDNSQVGSEVGSQVGMPKWLLYGLVAKGVLALAITIGVLIYAGVI